jgi:hypothetical protein
MNPGDIGVDDEGGRNDVGNASMRLSRHRWTPLDPCEVTGVSKSRIDGMKGLNEEKLGGQERTCLLGIDHPGGRTNTSPQVSRKRN